MAFLRQRLTVTVLMICRYELPDSHPLLDGVSKRNHVFYPSQLIHLKALGHLSLLHRRGSFRGRCKPVCSCTVPLSRFEFVGNDKGNGCRWISEKLTIHVFIYSPFGVQVLIP